MCVHMYVCMHIITNQPFIYKPSQGRGKINVYKKRENPYVSVHHSSSGLSSGGRGGGGNAPPYLYVHTLHKVQRSIVCLSVYRLLS